MELCVIRGYALSEVCVKRGSTVPLKISNKLSSALQATYLKFILEILKFMPRNITFRTYRYMILSTLYKGDCHGQVVPLHLKLGCGNRKKEGRKVDCVKRSSLSEKGADHVRLWWH